MPMRLSRVLPNLEALLIMDLDWRNPHKSFFMFLAGFSTVRILQMDDVYFDSPRRLLQFLSFFPHLNTLKLNGIQYGGGIPSSFHAGGVRPKLQLHMDSVEILQIAEDWHVMEWLNRSVLSTNSICIQISKLLGSRISVFQKFLDRNTSLRKLSISFARPVLAYDILGTYATTYAGP
ncbi:hypothetical protein PHLCEN_2v5739 [Hermanssonia centrifuga]|uniref:Uncharacterized protein n=1 Tax=Hermanssonia centrifuga TaxID=98765 RepID=A0A2R6P1K2_9APHY|nr:hypothetical protein PHLCEN_2v5739 [Hermanssonia centrifuga]